MRRASRASRRARRQWVKFYGAEVLLALEYLHSCGFIYRCGSLRAGQAPKPRVAHRYKSLRRANWARRRELGSPGGGPRPAAPHEQANFCLPAFSLPEYNRIPPALPQRPEAGEHPAARLGPHHAHRLRPLQAGEPPPRRPLRFPCAPSPLPCAPDAEIGAPVAFQAVVGPPPLQRRDERERGKGEGRERDFESERARERERGRERERERGRERVRVPSLLGLGGTAARRARPTHPPSSARPPRCAVMTAAVVRAKRGTQGTRDAATK